MSEYPVNPERQRRAVTALRTVMKIMADAKLHCVIASTSDADTSETDPPSISLIHNFGSDESDKTKAFLFAADCIRSMLDEESILSQHIYNSRTGEASDVS